MFLLDHLFILSPKGAPIADRLVELGFVEGPPNKHPGQGTENRRFFFENLMLEFLWIHDRAETSSAGPDKLQLVERFERGSPFGICLRSEGAPAEPFGGWTYRPPYLPSDKSIWVGEGRADEPLCFYLDFIGAPGPSPQSEERKRVTAVVFHGASPPVAGSVFKRTLEHSCVRWVSSGTPLLALQFSGGRAGRNERFEPDCPLQLSW